MGSMQQRTDQAPASRGTHPAVFDGQIDYLFQQLPRLLGYSVVVTFLLAAMLWKAVPPGAVATWMAAMLLILLIRLVLYFRYRRKGERSPTRYWARWYVLLAGASGLVWGSAGVILFAPGQLEMQALVVLVLAGMAAASASVLPMYLPAFYAFMPTAMIPAGVMMVLQRDSFHLFLSLLDVVFILGMLAFGRAIGEAFRSSLELRFENLDLVTELQRQKVELQRANQAKSKFLAAASHDLRQPMHALTLFSELLDEKAANPETRALASHIGSAVGVLERLFAALLDISKLDAGVLVPEVDVFRVQDVLDHVVNDCLPRAQEKRLELTFQETDFYTESDPTLLERILRNLVNNAIRYTDSGSVRICCEAVADGLCLSVEDTGIGIEPEQFDYIFEEFTQLHNPERNSSKGLGLGLSIVQRLARLLDHPLEIQSQPGRGTRVRLTLPLSAPSGNLVRKPAIARSEHATLDITVLVVDDDPEVLAGTSALLETWGCTVIRAMTAGEALRVAAQTSALDAVLTDFRLPGNESGTRLVQKIREWRGAVIPALLVTGDTEPARLQEAREHGLTLLHKPVKPARLRAWLAKLRSDGV
jgi:signal transduction histidine kinase/CheY-like chemotaxis protein